jgi:hypothetical protein
VLDGEQNYMDGEFHKVTRKVLEVCSGVEEDESNQLRIDEE